MIKFGTDGVRGIANKDLTPEDAFSIGRATGYVLGKRTGKKTKVLIGKDTRISSNMLEAALVAGICSVGAEAYIAGVIPTPAIATMVKKYEYNLGIMISASHNPVPDNGIKIFNCDGYKLADEVEEQIIQAIYHGAEDIPRPTGKDIGTYYHSDSIEQDYIQSLKATVGNMRLDGIKIGLDCANGATYSVAPKIFEELGATVHAMHNQPNGININENCGSTHMDSLVECVTKNGLDIGIAFDGDGDRCLVVDSKGHILCGDQIMSIVANHLKDQGALAKNTLVTTIMSNIGMDQMGKKHDINVVRTTVGDRYVLEQMLANGYNFGGEQSGHFIFLDHTTTGDGILAALQLLKVMVDKKQDMASINQYITMHPQITMNAYVHRDKKDSYKENPAIKAAVDVATKKYEGTGRVLVRASGTEAMVRVTLEGENLDQITETATELKNLIESELS